MRTPADLSTLATSPLTDAQRSWVLDHLHSDWLWSLPDLRACHLLCVLYDAAPDAQTQDLILQTAHMAMRTAANLIANRAQLSSPRTPDDL